MMEEKVVEKVVRRAASAQDFKKFKKRDVFRIPVKPGLLGDDVDCVFCRTFTEKERGDIARAITQKSDGSHIPVELERPYVVAYGVCDEDGNRLFLDDDIDWLVNTHAGLIEAVYGEIERRCKVTLNPKVEDSRIEEAAKN